MKKKLPLMMSLALAAVLVIGQAGFAQGSDDKGVGNMMNGNGMMGNGEMSNMMEAMNSPEGQKMMQACGDFMASFDEDEDEGKNQK